MSEVILRLEHVTKVYGRGTMAVTALNNVSLEVNRGEIVVILGPSGAGKTTLLNVASGLDVPSKGSIFFVDQELSVMKVDERARLRSHNMGFIFQLYNLIPTLTAIENVELPLIYQNVALEERRRRAKEMLALVGLEHRADHWPSELSGGEQQRIAVARALIVKPQIIFADEPTSNVDSETGLKILDLIVKQSSEKTAILVATHDPKVVDVASRIIGIRDGKVSDRIEAEFIPKHGATIGS